MKTLKKTLCLILAVVMAVGVLVIPANAAYDDFTDKDAIEHTTAVAVLSGMGIIAGKDTGAYDPQGTLTREEAAKLVVYALLGPTSAEQLDGSTVMFPDVPTTNWANKYITYAAQAGIINGVGDGNFNPKGTLTGYELAKLLLVAAGVEGNYTGNNWKNEVMLAANRVGLLKETDVALADVINRDDAAQLIWNAVNYSPNGETRVYTVYLENGAENSGYDPAEDTYIWDGTDATSALIQQMVSGGKIWQETVSEGSLGDVVFGLKPGSTTDDWGRPVTIYTNGKGSSDPAYKLYASFTSNSTTSYTTGVTLDKVLSDVGYKSNQGPATLTIVEDGVTTNNPVTVRGDDAKKVALGGYGSLVDVLKNGNNVAIYVINTYVAKIDSVSPYRAATADRDEEKAHVTIKVGDEKTLTFNTDKFAKNDIVIYTVNKDSDVIVNMAIADTVSGKVTATGNNYIRVDGNQMYVARNAKAENLKDDAKINTTDGYKYDANTTYTFYKDFRDNVIAVKKGEEEAVDTDYIYVDRIEAVADYGNTTGDLIQSSTGSSIVAKARVIHLDTGAVEVVNLGMVQNDQGVYYYANTRGAKSSKPVVEYSENVRTYYEYVVLTDGSYVLDNFVTGKPVETIGTVTLKRGQAKLAEGLFANSSTATTVVTFNPDSSKTKTSKTSMTGYNAYPADADEYTALYVDNSNGIVSELYIVTSAAIVETAVPVNYAIFAGMGEQTDVLNYVFYVNGEQVSYHGEVEDFISMKAGEVYDISVEDNELVKATPVSDNKDITIVEDVTVVTIQGEYFIAKKDDTNNLYNFADNCLIVDAGDNYAKAELAADDVVTVYVKDGKAELIIIAE